VNVNADVLFYSCDRRTALTIPAPCERPGPRSAAAVSKPRSVIWLDRGFMVSSDLSTPLEWFHESEFASTGIDQMSIEDRLALAQRLWDSVVAELERQPLTPEQRAELERRVAAADANPDAGIPWEVIRAAGASEVATVSLPIIFLPEARAEFDDAYGLYEGQQAGLGEGIR